MSDKLAVILLDALGPRNVYNHQLLPGLETIRDLYKQNGEVLGISSLPHTAQSNPLIFGGFVNKRKFWVEADGEWIDPSTLFEHRGHEHNRPDAEEYRNYERSDFDESFIWDVLDSRGYDPVALQVPIVLPPFSYNADRIDQESWFPDTKERMEDHIHTVPQLVRDHAEAGHDFIASSIQMPDKWLHGLAEGKVSRLDVKEQSEQLDQEVASMVETLEDEGYDWVIAGDHGSPTPGIMPVHEAQELLPRHRKEAIIFGSKRLDLPTYTGDMYKWMGDYFGVDVTGEDVRYLVDQDKEVPTPVDEDEVMERLEALGYK